jgi:serine-type D-Ala-D-Ala carboxypeptidase (penicillin-binding protein 5/6)
MTRAGKVIVVVAVLLCGAAAGEARVARRQARTTNHSTRVTAKAAILVDNQTGEILWQRNPDLPLPPASTTKIVTALLALQSGRLDDSLTVTTEAAQAPPSKISLRPGWRMRVRDLVYAVLLNSANDASVVIAEGLSGSISSFAERMNTQARLLGATNTHFVNPNGLPAANHYSTVRDLSTMFAHALRNPMFESIVNTKSTTVMPTLGSTRLISLHTHNRLLGNYHIHVVGKTGWTIAAKKCFVGAATADGRELIVAVMGSNDLWGDLKRLLEFGFSGNNEPPTDPEVVEASIQNEVVPVVPVVANAAVAAPAVAAPSVAARTVAGDDADDAPSPRTHRYAVQLATFRQFKAATQLKKAVAAKGYAARVDRFQAGRRSLYRVSVGNYSDRRAAQQAANQIKKTHGHLTPFIVAAS